MVTVMLSTIRRRAPVPAAGDHGADRPHRDGDDGPAVEVRAVTRHFGGVRALHDLDIVAPRGRITVLLGPNGAGKTTAIRIITGALPPDAGTVRTLGLDPAVDGGAVRARCGVVSAKPALYDRLSGRDNLRYSGRLYGVGGDLEVRIREAAARFGIEQALDAQVGGYSTGMKTRLALARSVLHEPVLLLYDEPTSGLDPESSQAVLRLIRDMTHDGHTVVLCTHHLVEAEGLADHVVVLDAGTALTAGAPADLAHELWPDAMVRLGTEDPAHLALLDGQPGVLRAIR
jgi:ABC-2 type transport system ATP-binding protein